MRTFYLGRPTESFLNDFTGTWTDAEAYLRFSPSQSYTGTLRGRTISFPSLTT